MCKKWGVFFTRDLEKNKEKHFHSAEIENDILVFINIKPVLFDSLIKSNVHLIVFRQTSMIVEGSPNSLT